MSTISAFSNTKHQTDGMRVINLRTDLAPLADLIELVFQDTMDEGGRAAIREMRYMSRLGVGLNVLGRLNEMALGVSNGYIWIEDQQLVGNVSIFPANWGNGLESSWIIANVATHPDYQRRGIARRLMYASLDLIRQKGGKYAILQTDYNNQGAIQLYEDMGFIRERSFTTWIRSSFVPPPRDDAERKVFITRRKDNEWQAEYDLINRLRPNERGGIGWLKPVHESTFHRNILQEVIDWFSFSTMERLIVRSDDGQAILASLWVDNSVSNSKTRFYLFADAENIYPYASALVHNAVRRWRNAALIIEHPHDDTEISALLQSYRFNIKRTVWHMRLDL